MEMNLFEELAALTALQKAVGDRVKAVRDEANAQLLGSYDSIGVEKMALKMSGEKVGEFAVIFHKEWFEVTDQAALDDFAIDYGFASERVGIKPEYVSLAISALADAVEDDVNDYLTREVSYERDWEKRLTDTAGVITYMDSGLPVPGVAIKPPQVKGTVIRDCKPERVFPIIASMPGGFNGLMLGEGGDDGRE